MSTTTTQLLQELLNELATETPDRSYVLRRFSLLVHWLTDGRELPTVELTPRNTYEVRP